MPGLQELTETLENEFPRSFEGKKGLSFVIRPLKKEDEKQLLAFFRDVPVRDMGRFFRENVADPGVAAKWCHEIDYARVLPLIAFEGDKVVADATVHVSGKRWRSHVGVIRLTVHPRVRGNGLGRVLVEELLDLAPLMGLDWVNAEVASDEKGALTVLEGFGFKREAELKGQVRDPKGALHDLVILTRGVKSGIEPDIGGG